MHIPDRMAFQPSSETQKKWLATRKPTHFIGRVEFPGFFSDTGNSADQNWFMLAIIGEALGLGASIYAGISSGDISILIFAVVVVVVFIILDIVFAVKLHRNEWKKCFLRSTKMAFNDDTKAEVQEIARIQYEIEKGKTVDFFLKLGIIVIATIKAIGVFSLNALGTDNIVLYILVAIIYYVVAYIHIKNTGFYLAYRSTQNAISNEHKEFALGQHTAFESEIEFETPSELKLPIRQNQNEVVRNDAKTNSISYVLKSRGLLIDDDIIGLIGGKAQDDANKIVLFRACRKLQIENINQNG